MRACVFVCLDSLFKESLPFLFFETASACCIMGESTQNGYSRPLMKSKTKPWPRHSAWKQITFQSHSLGNARDWTDSFGWQATQHRKQDLGALCIRFICQRMPLWECRRWDKECLQINCFYLRGVPDGWGSPRRTAQRTMRQSQIVFKCRLGVLFCGYPF